MDSEQNPCFPRVHIERVDYQFMTLFDAQGNEYYELPDSTWTIIGQPHEGSVRYWGSGSHAGHINLFPLMYYTNGHWVNIRTGAPCD